MAIIRAYVGLDFVQGISLGPNVQILQQTATQFVISDGTTVLSINGQGFAYTQMGVSGGTVTGLSVTSGGQQVVDVTQLSLPATTAFAYLVNSDAAGLLAAALSGADTVFGSEFGDRLATFAGNDVIDLGGGNDWVDGGANIDTVVLDGPLADYEITATSATSYQIVDRNSANGSEGTDQVLNVERVRFGDGSEYELSALVAGDQWYKSTANVELVASTYQFFTDRIPVAQGFEYLIKSDQNPNDLNDPYYEQFNRENRYINFASNLGTDGEGAAKFEAQFGSLNFEQTIKAAYQEIMGSELAGAALAFFLAAQGFYESVAAERVVRPGVDLAEATKIVAIGSILNEAIKSGAGAYADAVEALVADLAPDGASTVLGGDLFDIA